MATTKKFIGGALAKTPAVAKQVKKAAAKQKRAVGTNQSGKKFVKDMSKIERLEFEFDGLKPTAQRAIIGNVRAGKESKYADMLKERKGIKVKKGSGGKMKSKGYKAGGKTTKKSAGGAAGAAMQYMEGRKKRRVQAAKDLGSKVLKKGGGKMKSKGYKIGGKMSGKPRGVGCATRGYGKAMK